MSFKHGVWDALIASVIAAAIGALLAVLACVPYDQVLGLSPAWCVSLRIMTSVAVVTTCLASRRPGELPLVYQV
jgi:hypothetical protein